MEILLRSLPIFLESNFHRLTVSVLTIGSSLLLSVRLSVSIVDSTYSDNSVKLGGGSTLNAWILDSIVK